MMRSSFKLKSLLHGLGALSKSAYDDDNTTGRTKPLARGTQSVPDSEHKEELLIIINTTKTRKTEEAKKKRPAPSPPQGNQPKRQKTAEDFSINCVSGFSVTPNNTEVLVAKGGFFGVGLDRSGHSRTGNQTRICRVDKCYVCDGQYYVRVCVYSQSADPPPNSRVDARVVALKLPFLVATDKFEFCHASELNMPLHVLHACGPGNACPNVFGFATDGPSHNELDYPLFLLNIYHPGSIFFGE
jgi:hypothetical protein